MAKTGKTQNQRPLWQSNIRHWPAPGKEYGTNTKTIKRFADTAFKVVYYHSVWRTVIHFTCECCQSVTLTTMSSAERSCGKPSPASLLHNVTVTWANGSARHVTRNLFCLFPAFPSNCSFAVCCKVPLKSSQGSGRELSEVKRDELVTRASHHHHHTAFIMRLLQTNVRT